MKVKHIIIPVLILFVNTLIAQQPLELILQQRGEVVISVQEEHLSLIENIHMYSIERPVNGRCQVYLNQKQYNYFVARNIPFVPQIAPSFLYEALMAEDLNGIEDWDAYPTYDAYLTMMQQFAIDFPAYCKLDTIGYSEENRLLLVLKISDNVELDETEPEFFYTSSMHGDELVGFVLMLRLADYLLNNLEDEKIARLVNNIEIYINPLANPDGTYFAGNNTVQGATRANANGVNLNRNFPDPEDGEHPDGNAYQAETIAMMDYMEKRNFVMSMNHHGGAEVINYPWDTFQKLHADDGWFSFVSRNYADTVHKIDEFYMTDLDNGITNGFAWYSISGGRQDYANYFLNCREVTSELSTVKLPDASELPGFWEKNYKSLLNYMEQTLFGVSGIVTDNTDNAINAKITVLDYDIDNSHVFTQDSGICYRYLKAGTYSFLFEAEGYSPVQINNVEVKDFERTNLSVQFQEPLNVGQEELFAVKVFPNPAKDFITIELSLDVSVFNIKLYDCYGKLLQTAASENTKSVSIPLHNLPKGIYVLVINNNESLVSKKIVIE